MAFPVIASLPGVPVGTAFPYTGSEPPLGYVWGEGQVVSRDEYPELYAVVKKVYREKSWIRRVFAKFRRKQAFWSEKLDKSGQFRVPDFRGTVPVGVDPATKDGLPNFVVVRSLVKAKSG